MSTSGLQQYRLVLDQYRKRHPNVSYRKAQQEAKKIYSKQSSSKLKNKTFPGTNKKMFAKAYTEEQLEETPIPEQFDPESELRKAINEEVQEDRVENIQDFKKAYRFFSGNPTRKDNTSLVKCKSFRRWIYRWKSGKYFTLSKRQKYAIIRSSNRFIRNMAFQSEIEGVDSKAIVKVYRDNPVPSWAK